jgi:4-amino-4-deoxy-L-arabinose transferase
MLPPAKTMLQPNSLRSSQLLYGLLLVFFLLLLYNAGGWGVIETSEARYAEISREMLRGRDWLHPRLLGIQHFHKPPVTYMVSAIGMELFGVNAFGVRFFLQVSLVLQALLVYGIGQLLFRNNKQALIAVVVYITMPAVLISARNLTTDSFLTTFELVAIYTWLKHKYKPNAAWLYFFYLLLALAFLTKGPVGLIFPVLVVIGYRQAGAAHAARYMLWHHLPALLLLLAVGASWYVYLMWQDTQFLDYFVFKHTVQRYATPETFGRSKLWWFYLVLTPALSLPWSAILLFHYKKLKALPRAQAKLFIFWLLAPLVFFSFSGSKLILYILPLFAGMALLVSWLLTNLSPEAVQKAAKGSMIYFAVLALALLLAPVVPVGVSLPWETLLLPLLILVGLFFIRRSKYMPLQQLLLSSLVFSLLLLPFSTHLLAHNPSLMNGSSPIADVIVEKQLQQRHILVYDRLLPSLAFELDKDIVTLHDQNNKLERETQFERDESWRQLLLRLDQPQGMERLQALLRQRTVLVVRDELPENRKWLLRHFEQKQQVGKWVVYY